MKSEEFELLQRLTTRGLSKGTALDSAARLVLVDGCAVRTAADRTGVIATRLHRKVNDLRAVRADILKVFRGAK